MDELWGEEEEVAAIIHFNILHNREFLWDGIGVQNKVKVHGICWSCTLLLLIGSSD